MGYGDNLMASGIAKGAYNRGVQIAFGDGERVIWDKHSALIFKDNPNVVRPGLKAALTKEWYPFYKGHRLYNREEDTRFVWNMNFRAQPGEIFLDPREKKVSKRFGTGFTIIEPHVPMWKSWGVNKDWGFANYQKVADQLVRNGHAVAQLMKGPETQLLKGVQHFQTSGFRDALAILRCAKLYVGPEGGLHHGAAAVNTQAVVIFGGFIPPLVTGYTLHVNLVGSQWFCGRRMPCSHCADSMQHIKVSTVVEATEVLLHE